MIEFGLIVARFLHYVATTTLAGATFFPLYAYAGAEPEFMAHRRTKILAGASVVAFISGVAWFAFAVAGMSGEIASVVDPEVIVLVVRDTGFGIVWAVRMIIAAAIVLLTIGQAYSRKAVAQDLLTTVLAASLLASLAGSGHAQVEQGWYGVLHVTSDAAHLLAAAAWLGGLIPLGLVLVSDPEVHRRAGVLDVDNMLSNFSGMGYAAVATLLATGLVNSWFLVGSVSNMVGTTYGRILIAKLAFFVGMLALAAANRFWLVPKMQRAKGDDPNGRESWRRRLRTHVLGEQALGLLVLFSVSVLGTIRPAIGQ